MSRALFLTSSFNLQAKAAAGIFGRQRMMLDGVRRAAGEVHALYFAHHDPSYGGGHYDDDKLRAIAAANWGPDVQLRVCRRAPPLGRLSWRQRWRGMHSLLAQPGYASISGDAQRQAFEQALNDVQPDFIFVHRLMSMPPVLSYPGKLPSVFFDLDDIEHIALRRGLLTMPVAWRNLPDLLQIPGLIAGERAALARSALTLVCSELDANKIRAQFAGASVQAVPNSVPLPPHSVRGTGLVLLMVGSYGYGPNRHGLEHFASAIWPMVRSRVPDARLLVVGPRVQGLSFHAAPPEGIECLGFVDHVADAYAQAAAVICPIYSGGGTRLKIVEAAAHGMPIVSTPLGAEGLDLLDGQDVLLAQDDASFAAQCVRLLMDPAFATRIGDAARATAEQRFNQRKIVDDLAATIRRVVDANPRQGCANTAVAKAA